MLPIDIPRSVQLADVRAALQAAIAARYRLDRELGRGGMGVVFLADDLQCQRPVAIKILRPELAAALGPHRFSREVRITAHLQHPNILQVIDAGAADGIPYYVTPYLEGESLAARLTRDRQLPIADALQIASDVADALSFAHAHGVVHRDIKPGNILLAGGRAVVADFGIARALDEAGGERLTSSGVALGTPTYMSPEQACGAEQVDGRSDIYSLGCVLYEMLAGEPPFTGPSAQAVLARQLAEPVRHLRVVRDTVPVGVEQVIEKALAKVPADRYATALELKEALAHGATTAARPPRAPLRRRLLPPAALVLAAALMVLVWRVLVTSGPGLDPDRVVVFPLVAAQADGAESEGEDLATIIGHALDGVGPLRWIDGWSLLDEQRRSNPRTLELHAARTIARAQAARFFVTGRLVAHSESTGVYLQLYDAGGDSTAARTSAVAAPGELWQAGLRSANALLPVLIPSGAPAIGEEWFARRPAAVASFFLGEARMRRAQMAAALEHYRAAVAADSLFTLAAIRGAEAASWRHETRAARELITLALGHRRNLEPRLAAFTEGYAAYLDGKPEDAIAALREAVEIDPSMGVAWWALGETYTHLLPRAGPVDSLAEVSLKEAYRRDPSAVNALYHLLEIAIRKRDRAGALRLRRAYDAAEPDSSLVIHIRLMHTCAFDGPDAVDWQGTARRLPQQVLTAGKALGAGGAHPACAERAFRAILTGDTASDAWGVGRRWSALLGLQSLLLARGRSADVERLLDSAARHGLPPATALYLLDAAVGAGLRERAAEMASRDSARFGPEYRGTPFSDRLWLLAVWEASRGRAHTVAAIADELRARAERSGARHDALLARAAAAHATLARGDSARALRLFEALVPTGSGDELVWDLVEPLAVERLVLVKLLIAKGRMAEALDVGAVFDGPKPLMHLLLVRQSLDLRLEAARALADANLTRRLERRLARLEE